MPSVNQIPFNLFHSGLQNETIAWNAAHGVVTNGYSPFGKPDHTPPGTLLDPVAASIATTHGVTTAVVQLAWQWASGIIVNPRSQNARHQLENLGADGNTPFWELQLSPAETAALWDRPQEGV